MRAEEEGQEARRRTLDRRPQTRELVGVAEAVAEAAVTRPAPGLALQVAGPPEEAAEVHIVGRTQPTPAALAATAETDTAS